MFQGFTVCHLLNEHLLGAGREGVPPNYSAMLFLWSRAAYTSRPWTSQSYKCPLCAQPFVDQDWKLQGRSRSEGPVLQAGIVTKQQLPMAAVLRAEGSQRRPGLCQFSTLIWISIFHPVAPRCCRQSSLLLAQGRSEPGRTPILLLYRQGN